MKKELYNRRAELVGRLELYTHWIANAENYSVENLPTPKDFLEIASRLSVYFSPEVRRDDNGDAMNALFKLATHAAHGGPLHTVDGARNDFILDECQKAIKILGGCAEC